MGFSHQWCHTSTMVIRRIIRIVIYCVLSSSFVAPTAFVGRTKRKIDSAIAIAVCKFCSV